jgi:hypothetical protein
MVYDEENQYYEMHDKYTDFVEMCCDLGDPLDDPFFDDIDGLFDELDEEYEF